MGTTQRILRLHSDKAPAFREEAHLLLEHWATPDGGFILSDYGDGRAIGVELDKKQVMLDAFLEADSYRVKRET
jgi:hypothetical protein